MTTPSAIVVGAGVGGLAAALGLSRAGWTVRVLEQRRSIDRTGAGISIWPNGGRALAMLGVEDAALSGAVLGGRSGIRSTMGRWIARTDLTDAISHRCQRPLSIIARGQLLTVLRAALAAARGFHGVEHGIQVSGADSDTDHAWVELVDGQRSEADVVIVADGARSRLRSAVISADVGLHYAGYTSWRLVTPAPAEGFEPAETWGKDGQRFAILPLNSTQVYCYATANSDPLSPASASNVEAGSGDRTASATRGAVEREQLQQRFGDWHAPIPQILSRADPTAIVRTDIVEMAHPPARLHRDRLVLLGDAAHTMTPDLGQGGCLALEDAATLATLLNGHDEPPAIDAALSRYSTIRGPRGIDIVRRSHRAGRIYQAPPKLAQIAARIGALAPTSLAVRALAPVIDWEPPAFCDSECRNV